MAREVRRCAMRATWVGAVEALEGRRLMHAGHVHAPALLPAVAIGPASDPSGIVALADLQHENEHAQAAREAAEFKRLHPEGPPKPVTNAVAPQAAADVGEWGAVMDWSAVAIHAAILPSGKIIFWDRQHDPRLYDPETGNLTSPSDPEWNTFCSGQVLLPDGRLFVAGGHIRDEFGLPNAGVYNPTTNAWTNAPDMNAARWYPTATTLADGNVLVTSGDITDVQRNNIPQIYRPATNDWRTLSGATLETATYPWMYQAANGQVFNAGPRPDTRYLNVVTGNGAWSSVIDTPNFTATRGQGTSVMYDDGKILVAGGANTTATAEVINLNDANPTWRSVDSMSSPRRHLNSTVLPDGRVLITGGVSGTSFNNRFTPVYAAEMWDPATEQFTTMAQMSAPRWYHSTAMLLPDGRVLTAGGDDTPNAQVYSPPYLFKGARPTITSAPSAIGYGRGFTVATPDAANVASIALVRFGAVTHGFHMDQRFGRLTFTDNGNGTLRINAPADANRMPPGFYMLFLLDANGVPSVAKIVNLGQIALPTVDLVASDDKAVESTGDAASFLFTRSNDDLIGDLVVKYSIGGTSSDADYTPSPLTGTITITDGQSSATLTITPIDDGQADGKETLILSLLADDVYIADIPGTATVTISDVPNVTPAATIDSPVAGSDYGGGQTISFGGSGQDDEDGSLSGNSLSWSIARHFNGASTVVATGTGASGSFVIPTNGPADPNQFFRLTLTATDSDGSTDTDSIDIVPRTSAITLATNIAGIALTLDGQSPTPFTPFSSVEGILRTLAAATPQVVGGRTYDFVSWSDAGAASHAIGTPVDDATYTATFAERVAPPVSTTVRANADAYVRGGSSANSNFGTAATLIAKASSNADNVRETFLTFPISSLGSSILSAKVRLFGGMINTTTETTILALYVVPTTSWGETTIKYTGRPGNDPTPLAQLTVNPGNAWREWDVSAYVQQQKTAGASAVSFVIKALSSTSQYAQFSSDEASTNRPQLLVQTPGQPPPPPGVAIDLAAIGDATVRNGTFGNTNYGNDGQLFVKKASTANNTRELYLKFDLTTVTTITSAKLKLFGLLTNVVDSGTPNVAIYNATNTTWSESTLTYNNRPTSSTTVLAQKTITSTTGAWYEFDLTSFLQAEKAAGRNVVTLVIKATNTTNPVATFNSAEALTNQPVLSIT